MLGIFNEFLGQELPNKFHNIFGDIKHFQHLVNEGKLLQFTLYQGDWEINWEKGKPQILLQRTFFIRANK